MENGPVEFAVGGMEDEFSVPARQEPAANFTPEEPGKSPSGNSSPSKDGLPISPGPKPSVKKELQEIRKEQAEKGRARERQAPARQKSRKKQKTKGR